MDDKEEYLTEENYERGKRKILTIAFVILAFGLLFGGSLIATGIIKSSQVENKPLTEKAKEKIQSEIESLNDELATLKGKENQEFYSNGFSEEYYRLNNEIKTKESKLKELEEVIQKDKSGEYLREASMSKAQYIPLYIFGTFIILASFMISGPFYLLAKRREITAFATQQVMPVTKEGIEKMTPTMGNAAGSIAQKITKGIKDGMEDKDSNE